MKSWQRGAALLIAALLTVGTAVGCSPTAVTPTAPTTAPPATATSAPAPGGGVEAAVAAVDWPTGPAVARVNGVDIPTASWRQEVIHQLQLVTVHFEVDWSDWDNLARLPAFLDGEVERLITIELLRQAAAREGVTITDADVQQGIEAIKQELLASGQYKSLEEYLQANDLAPERFAALIRDQLLSNRMVAAHGGPDEVEHVHARLIVVADEARARELAQELADGASFAELAAAHSTDVGSRARGGDLGWIPHGYMEPELDRAAFALQPGESSGPVKSGLGYCLLQVEERAVRRMEEPILSEVRQRTFSEWLAAERAAADIEVFYQAAPATPR